MVISISMSTSIKEVFTNVLSTANIHNQSQICLQPELGFLDKQENVRNYSINLRLACTQTSPFSFA